MVEWYVPYGKIESFERTGKFSRTVKIQHKEEGVPPVITMLKLGSAQSDRVLALLADKTTRTN